MKLLIDMNLSVEWAAFLGENGLSAIHWSEVGDPRAPDTELLRWAREHQHLVFTHDLDFARILALTRASGPSVLQVRTGDTLPGATGMLVLQALRQHADALAAGAIIVVDPTTSRARLLPIQGPSGSR